MPSFAVSHVKPKVTAVAILLIAGIAAASRAEYRVGGLNELVVYGPGAHERGLPAVNFEQSPEGTFVEIPPTVHVHRYYFDGCKEFQGPLIQGGPTIVVANHPKSGRKMYIDVNLPAGAPVIAYTERCITYAYKDRRVVIEFSCTKAGDDHAIVKMLAGHGVLRSMRDHARRRHDQKVRQNGPPANSLGKAIADTGKLTIDTTVGAVGITAQATAGTIDATRKVIEALPPVNMLKSAAQQVQQRSQLAPVNSSIYANTKTPTTDNPTNR